VLFARAFWMRRSAFVFSLIEAVSVDAQQDFDAVASPLGYGLGSVPALSQVETHACRRS
jgi:hypothetical protein